MKRRHFLLLGGVATAGAAATIGFPRLARPPAPEGPLSPAARALVDRALAGLAPSRLLDCHVHMVGAGTGGTGCYVNPRNFEWVTHPVHAVRFAIYRKAAGIDDLSRGDAQYRDHLLALVRQEPRRGRAMILAFDQVHREDGTPVPDASEFYTPNDYVLSLAKEHADAFVPAASIHPYRKDAVAELERVAERGAVAVKWLPNAHLIDPASERCDPFYERLAKLGIPLLTHSGEEKAVDAEEAQKFGNPLRLRRALDAGVKVIVCHCASSGQGEDLDAAGSTKPLAPNLDLFLRMASDGRYSDRLYGDISALIQFNRCEAIAPILRKRELQGRLIYGSDYPLPAINVLIRTGKLEELGYITTEERDLVNEIDRHNPLLFDFVVKRVLALREGGQTLRFADDVFTIRRELFPKWIDG